MTEGMVHRHRLAFYEEKISYPRIIDYEGNIIGAIGAVVGGTITRGDPIAILLGYSGGRVSEILLRTGFTKARNLIRKLSDPFYRYVGFDPQDFVLLTGFKKDRKRELVTLDFEPTSLPQDEPHDKEYGEILARAISGSRIQIPPYGRAELLLREEEFTHKLLTKDVLSVGGPVNLDPLYEPMRSKSLPCSYELENPLCYPLDKTGNKVIYRYEILRKGRETPLIPEWNELNWGLITSMEKSIVFPRDAKGGVLFNISGCNWLGVAGAAIFLYRKENLRKLREVVEKRIGRSNNFQAIVKVPVDPIKRYPIHEQIELLEDEIYRIS